MSMSDASVSKMLDEAADRPVGRLYAAPDGRTARVVRHNSGYRVLLEDGVGLPKSYATLIEAQTAALRAMAGPLPQRYRKRPVVSAEGLALLRVTRQAEVTRDPQLAARALAGWRKLQRTDSSPALGDGPQMQAWTMPDKE